MKFRARVSILTAAALLSCGVLPVAHASNQDEASAQPEPTVSVAPETTPGGTPEPSPVESSQPPASPAEPTSPVLPGLPVSPGSPGSSDSTDGDMTMNCSVSYSNGLANISFAADTSYDQLTVTVSGQQVTPVETSGGGLVLQQPARKQQVRIELWRDASLIKECAVTLAATTPQPPPSTSPTPSSSVSPRPTPSPTPTQEPSSTPTPTPSSSASPSAVPTETALPPVPTVAPSTRPTAPGGESSTSTPVQPTSAPESAIPDAPESGAVEAPAQQGPRIIRQFSDDPRYLLPQLFGTHTTQGSRLIMPRPRDAQAGPPPLETLPPVSEEELNAIKAQLSAPHRADRTPATTADVANRSPEIAARGVWWPLLYLIGPLAVVGVLWGLLNRRRREH